MNKIDFYITGFMENFSFFLNFIFDLPDYFKKHLKFLISTFSKYQENLIVHQELPL